MTTSNGVAERLRHPRHIPQAEYGNASKFVMETVAQMRRERSEAADRIEVLERELYLVRNERDNARDHVADAEAQVTRLTEALLLACEWMPCVEGHLQGPIFRRDFGIIRDALPGESDVDNPSPAKTSTGA